MLASYPDGNWAYSAMPFGANHRPYMHALRRRTRRKRRALASSAREALTSRTSPHVSSANASTASTLLVRFCTGPRASKRVSRHTKRPRRPDRAFGRMWTRLTGLLATRWIPRGPEETQRLSVLHRRPQAAGWRRLRLGQASPPPRPERDGDISKVDLRNAYFNGELVSVSVSQDGTTS